MIPSFRVSGHFPPFRRLGFGVIFRCSAVPRFRLLGFGLIFRRSAVPPFRRSAIPPFRHSAVPSFRRSAVPSFRLLGLPQNRCELMTKTILLLPKFILSKMSHESEHSESEFYYPGELSHAELLHQSPTHPKSKERNLTLFANEEAHNFLRNQQANRRSRKQLFRINCPITNL